MTLLLAVLTEKNQDNAAQEDYVLSAQADQELAFDQIRLNEEKNTEN